MKRLLIFMWGPVAALAIVSFILRGASIPLPLLAGVYASVLAISFVPFIVDWFLASRLSLSPRMVVVGLAGALVALVVASLLNSHFLQLGFGGAVASAVSSWLSSEKQKESTDA